ncbi:ankyrin repeat domain-containing protein 44, partial [Thraustotheca clavata]
MTNSSLMTQQDVNVHDINRLNVNGKTVLMQACEDLNVVSVKTLLENPKLNVMIQNQYSGQTAFHYACCAGNLEILHCLLAFVPDINHTDFRGRSGLHEAIIHNQIAVVNLLLDAIQICVNQPDKDGKTPLMLACFYNRFDILSNLLHRKDLDIDHCDKDGCNALHIATERNYTPNVRLLLTSDYKPDVNSRNAINGITSLMLVKDGGFTARVLLRQPGINVNAVDNNGSTAFIHAAQNDRMDVLELFTTIPDLDINIVNNDGLTAFSIACLQKNPMLAAQIMQMPKMDLSSVNAAGGHIAFAVACALHHIDCVSRLLESPDIDPNYKDA